MSQYVDGFVVPLPKKNLAAYRSMARKAGKLWIEHGAFELLKDDETVVFSRSVEP